VGNRQEEIKGHQEQSKSIQALATASANNEALNEKLHKPKRRDGGVGKKFNTEFKTRHQD